MFTSTINKCLALSYRVRINRNICGSSKVTDMHAFSYEKQKESSRNKQKLTNGTLVQHKRYQSNTTAVKDELEKIMTVFPDIVKDLSVDGNIINLPDVAKWFSEVLRHNVSYGKHYRPLVLMLTYRTMAKPEMQTPENIRLAMILGWCIQLFQGCFQIVDDIMDKSETRRGAPCWYKRQDVAMNAVNDAFLLKDSAYAIISKYFHDKPYYANILEIFQDVLLKSTLGQHLDSATLTSKKPLLELFTYEQLEAIAKYKTTFYSLFLPIQLGLCLAGTSSEMEQAKPVLFDLGYFFQVENDFLDCYGDPVITGKIGTDIEERKCTWLAVKALQKGSSKQRKLMEECYGSPDPQKVAAIKDLYKELNLPGEYAAFKDETKTNIQIKINSASSKQLHSSLQKIYEIFMR